MTTEEENKEPEVTSLEDGIPDDLPESEKSGILNFFKRISGNVDLSTITAPVSMCDDCSGLQMVGRRARFLRLMDHLKTAETPLERMICMVRYILAAYNVASSGKKPLNPVYREQYHCYLGGEDDGCAQWEIAAEQLSHHPPVSGEHFMCPELNVVGYSHYKVDMSFIPTQFTLKGQMKGRLQMMLLDHKESYHFTFPKVFIRNIVRKAFIDYCGEVTVTCPQTGLQARITLEEKPWFKGHYHQLHGSIVRLNPDDAVYEDIKPFENLSVSDEPSAASESVGISASSVTAAASEQVKKEGKKGGLFRNRKSSKAVTNNEELVSFSGNFKGKVYMWDGKYKVGKNVKEADYPNRRLLVDVGDVVPLAARADVRSEHCSDNVWGKVCEALRAKDMQKAKEEKDKVEQMQRNNFKTWAKNDEQPPPQLFHYTNPADAVVPKDLRLEPFTVTAGGKDSNGNELDTAV